MLHRISNNNSIAVTQFCIIGLKVLLGFLVFRLDKLVAAEQVMETFLLVYGLEYTFLDDTALQFPLRYDGIAMYINLVDDDFAVLSDVDVNNYLVRSSRVVMLHNLYFGILESLILKIALAENLGTVYHIGSKLVVLHKSHLVF